MQILDRSKLLLSYNQELERRCERAQIERDKLKHEDDEIIERSVREINKYNVQIEGLQEQINKQKKTIV